MRNVLRWCVFLFVCGLFSAQIPSSQHVGAIGGGDVTVTVEVMDMLTRLPMSGVKVSVKGWDLLGITDALGRSTLRGPMLKSWLEVRAARDGYEGMSEVRWLWQQQQHLRIALPPSARLKEADEWIRDPATLDPHRHQQQIEDSPRPLPRSSGTPLSTPLNGPLNAGITYALPKNIQVKMNDGSIVTMDLEEYMKGVLPKEIGCGFPMESMKAQAVAARTYAVDWTAGGTKAICITTSCQVWGTTRCDSTNKAVDATRGQVAVYIGSDTRYKNKLAGGYFAASCGGSTINVEDKWSFRPFLRAKSCIENKGTACSVVCKPTTSANSTCWGIYGHRIGLCQRGSESMGKCGKSHEEIVKHYYTDVEIANMAAAPPDVDDAKLTGETASPNTDIYPKQKITKTWKLQNTGNTTWTSKEGYALLRTGGPDLQGPASLQLNTSDSIAPNQQRDFSANFVAPDQPGTYESQWQMDHKGKKFGPVVKLVVVVKAQPPTCKDEDGDGFFAPGPGCPEPFDCDDKDKTVHPGAREICGNGKDDDCQGGDAPCPTQCVDNDKDGYFVKADGCPGPYDCDDNNKNVYPGAKEICGNGIDEDCQGGDLACPLQCVDKDGDGYFVKADGCPGPYDCDDNNKDIYPGAKEICGNGIDEDCQGGDLPCSGQPPVSQPAKKKLGERGCTKNSDCESNFCVVYRDEAICSLPCQGTGQATCPAYYTCFQETACWPEPGYQIPLVACTQDSDCTSGGSCMSGRCTDGFRVGGSGCRCSTEPSSNPPWFGLILCLFMFLGLWLHKRTGLES